MPEEQIETTEDKGAESLQTEGPIDERDEVKQAEERTRQQQKSPVRPVVIKRMKSLKPKRCCF